MSGDTTITASLLLSLIAAVGVIVSILSSRKNDVEGLTKKAVDTATRFTELNVKLDMIMQQFTELARTNEKRGDEIISINHNIAQLSSKIERLFEYKDYLEERIARLEGDNHDNSKGMHGPGSGRNEKI